MLDDSSLPPDTQALLREIAPITEVRGFTLIGGTALALRHQHRLSEDIDLAWPHGSLPRSAIKQLLTRLSTSHKIRDLIPSGDRDEFENSGLELENYQQDWSVDGVKLTFYAPDPPEASLYQPSGEQVGEIAVASDDLLFKLKSRVVTKRTTSRDHFDLWYFVDRCGRTFDAILQEMAAGTAHHSLEWRLARLTPSKYPLADPGFETELVGAPKTKDELKDRFSALAGAFQRDNARQIALAQMQGRGR